MLSLNLAKESVDYEIKNPNNFLKDKNNPKNDSVKF